jgi:hypothetical protein
LNKIALLKPAGSRRMLLFAAACVWSFAGLMLLGRGISLSMNIKNSYWIKIISVICGGSLFYLVLFAKISSRHIKRILNLKSDRPCLFSFFSFKSYIMMALMISTGIFLRKSGIIGAEYLSLAYITMGIPLLISALNFIHSGLNYRNI